MNEMVPRDEKGRILPGYSGNPRGRPKMPEAVKEALSGTGAKAIMRLKALIEDDTAWGRQGWLGQDQQLRAIGLAVERAYGKAEITREKEEDSAFTPGQVVDLLDRVYEQLKAPELRHAMRADEAIDVTPEGDDV